MQRIVVRHLSGSKSNQVEEFPLNHFKEIVFGRDPSCSVKYDPDRDDLVGRQHSKIAPDANDPTQFTITDLNSRNGTYVNKQRIVDPTKIAPGDLIQLGPGGPEFQFDLEPRPMGTVKATRSAAFDSLAPTMHQAGSSVPLTRQVDIGTPARSVSLGAQGTSASSTGRVGKATVERMISQNIAVTKRTEGRKYLMIGGAALATVLVLFMAVAGYLLYRSRTSETQLGQVQKDVAGAASNVPMTSATIAKNNRNAVVKIDVVWRLISPTGGLVYHRYDCEGGACYIEVSDGERLFIEPLLAYEKYGATSSAIGGKFAASGVVISNDGFILTNRHVAFAWETAYNFPEELATGTVIKRDGSTRSIDLKKEPVSWIPALTRQTIYTEITEKRKTRKVPQRNFDGRNERLDVFFPGAVERNVAQALKPSESQDVAMIRVNLPGNLPKVETNAKADSIKQGDTITVLGYPTVSSPLFGYKEDSISTRPAQQIFDPNVNSGNIGRLLRVQEASARKRGVYSEIGDVYQLAVNAMEPGYDGAPVFDDRGRVIGIFSIEKRLDVPIAVAVPIHYGMELTSVGVSR